MRNNGDGTVTDEATGLMWQQKTPTKQMTWEQSVSYCENLSLGGYTDWRLPTIKELQSLVDYSQYGPAINIECFSDTVSSWYWSSTTGAYGTNGAWCVYFYDGYARTSDKGYSYYVRAVRNILEV